MKKWSLLVVCSLIGIANSVAQTPPPGGYAPNFYNRQTQPLSPYLNLLRGGDPGINYYYGVRPGLQSQGLPTGLGSGGPNGISQLRMGFLPATQNPTQEPAQLPEAGEPISSLPSSGHPVTFNGIPTSSFGLNRFGLSTAGGGPGSRPSFNNQPPAAFNRKPSAKK